MGPDRITIRNFCSAMVCSFGSGVEMLNSYSLLILDADVNQGGGGWAVRCLLVILSLRRICTFYPQDSRLEVRRKDSPVLTWSPGRAASLAFIAGRSEASQGNALSQRKKQYLRMLRPYVRNKQMALSYEKETFGQHPSRGLETGESRVLAWSPGQPAWRLLLAGAKHPRATHCLNGRNNIYGCFAPTIRRRTEPAGLAML